MDPQSLLVWRKSRYSADRGNCVEVAHAPRAVFIRDSQNPAGPALSVGEEEWIILISLVQG
ncbi:DUF397 domain-containing protein [Nocardiopsis alba]|uniref:DUF397 domain-containing protein n=1 Tax=Nocardiopsis alba TaxID=53437 RepID=UPI00366587BC